MSLPYYKFHPAEELGNYHLMTLSHEALGIWYLLRVCQLWQHQGRIPDDAAYIAPLLRLSPEQWLMHRAEFIKRHLIQTIEGFITVAAFREQWERAKNYSDEQSAKRIEAIRAKKEKEILKKGRKFK